MKSHWPVRICIAIVYWSIRSKINLRLQAKQVKNSVVVIRMLLFSNGRICSVMQKRYFFFLALWSSFRYQTEFDRCTNYIQNSVRHFDRTHQVQWCGDNSVAVHVSQWWGRRFTKIWLAIYVKLAAEEDRSSAVSATCCRSCGRPDRHKTLRIAFYRNGSLYLPLIWALSRAAQ